MQKLKSKKRIAVFAGSFDPFTIGHLDIVKRASQMFNTLYVVDSKNANKKSFFSPEERSAFISRSLGRLANVIVAVHDGLTIDFMESVGACYLVRGVRTSADLEMELSIYSNNRILGSEVETVLFPCKQEYLHISSSVVREILLCSHGNSDVLCKYLPSPIVKSVAKSFLEKR